MTMDKAFSSCMAVASLFSLSGSRIPIAWHWPPSSYEAIAALLFYITIVTNLTLCLQAYWAEFTIVKYTNIKEAE